MTKLVFQHSPYYYQANTSQVEIVGDTSMAYGLLLERGDYERYKEFLAKVIEAIGIHLDDCCKYFIKYSAMYKWSQISTAHRNIISFGITPEYFNLLILFDYYATMHLENRKLLVGHSLEEVQSSVHNKKQLWLV